MVSQKVITYCLQNIHHQGTSYLSLCILYAFSTIPFSHSLHTSLSMYTGETRYSVSNHKKYIYLESFALEYIVPSLTHITSLFVTLHPLSLLTHSWKHITKSNVYTYISTSTFTNFPLMITNEHSFLYDSHRHLLIFSDRSCRVANHPTGPKLKVSIHRPEVIFS
jgi:hypothetical protein